MCWDLRCEPTAVSVKVTAKHFNCALAYWSPPNLRVANENASKFCCAIFNLCYSADFLFSSRALPNSFGGHVCRIWNPIWQEDDTTVKWCESFIRLITIHTHINTHKYEANRKWSRCKHLNAWTWCENIKLWECFMIFPETKSFPLQIMLNGWKYGAWCSSSVFLHVLSL